MKVVLEVLYPSPDKDAQGKAEQDAACEHEHDLAALSLEAKAQTSLFVIRHLSLVVFHKSFRSAIIGLIVVSVSFFM